jgi:hypothetical protein
MTPEALAETAGRLTANPDALATMGSAARAHARRFTHDAAFDAFWDLHPEAIRVAGLKTEPHKTAA